MAKKKSSDDIPENDQNVDGDDTLNIQESDDHLEEWLPEDTAHQGDHEEPILNDNIVSDFDEHAEEDHDPLNASNEMLDMDVSDSLDTADGDSFELDDPSLFEESHDYAGNDPKEELMAKLEEIQTYVMENKPAVIGGVVIALVLLVWIFGGSGEDNTKQKEAIAHQEEVSVMLTDREEALEQELKNFEEQFNQFSSQEEHKMNDLASKVALLFDQAKNTKQALIDQNRQLAEIKKAISRVADDQALKQRRIKAKRAINLYSVTAIVPGRVWLRSVNGHEFTASVGDKIEGYGAVVKIEPEYGRVQTSSGKSIYLGKDDS